MSRVACRALTIGLACLLAPGFLAAVEDVVRLVRTGHSAHVRPAADPEPAADEHGCAATLHLCGCHHSLISTSVAPAAAAQRPRAAGRFAAWARRPRTDPPAHALDHPPRT